LAVRAGRGHRKPILASTHPLHGTRHATCPRCNNGDGKRTHNTANPGGRDRSHRTGPQIRRLRAGPINLAISQAKLSRAQHTRQVIQQSCLSSYSKYNFKFMQDPLAIFYCPHLLSQPGSGGGTHNCRAVQATGAACSDKLILFPPSSPSHAGIC